MSNGLLSVAAFAALLGTGNVAQAAQPLPAGTLSPCEYDPTGPIPPLDVVGAARVSSIGETLRVDVVLRGPRGFDLKTFYPFFIAEPSHEPVRMEVTRGSRTALSDYWKLTGTIASRGPFTMYFDELWPGHEYATGRPCSYTMRHVLIPEGRRGS